MSTGRTRADLLAFLDYLADKGLMARATVTARKVAANRVLGILSGAEASDVTALDLNEAMRRFGNLQGKDFTPASLQTYLSRLRSAVDDFKTYLDNPLVFRPRVQQRERRRTEGKKEEVSGTSEEASVAPTSRAHASAPLVSSVLPIPLRADLTVYVQGLPFDLTDAEAAKIANVIRAMAMVRTD
jgi:hypothetical protein